MTTSGTYTWDISNADLLAESFDRCGIRKTSLTREHMISGVRSLNMELANLSNRGINLWTVDLVSEPLLEGQTVYDVDPNVVIMLDVYVRTAQDPEQPTDRILMPISRTDYAMIPNKLQTGQPTSFWFNRTLDPTVTIWPVPEEDDLWELRYYVMRRIQDANAKNGQTPDLQFRFLDAVCAGVAVRLALKYAPEREDKLKMRYTEALLEATLEDRERVPIYIIPQFGGYYDIG